MVENLTRNNVSSKNGEKNFHSTYNSIFIKNWSKKLKNYVWNINKK